LRDGWEHLANVSLELNQLEEWASAREGMLGSIQTTAGPWLTVARERIAKTQFKSARAALTEAAKVDPADTRAQVYEAVIDAANDKPDDALARYHVALVLEQARNQLHGRDLLVLVAATSKPGALPLAAEDIGLTLALRNLVGGLLFGQGQGDRAGKMFQANLDYLSTLPPEKLDTPVPAALLPSTTADVNAVPPPVTYAVLKIRAQGGLDCANWVSRNNDPKDVALATATFKRLVTDATIDSSNPAVVQAAMSLVLAELEVSKGNNAAVDVAGDAQNGGRSQKGHVRPGARPVSEGPGPPVAPDPRRRPAGGVVEQQAVLREVPAEHDERIEQARPVGPGQAGPPWQHCGIRPGDRGHRRQAKATWRTGGPDAFDAG
jgi:hypothetical protein